MKLQLFLGNSLRGKLLLKPDTEAAMWAAFSRGAVFQVNLNVTQRQPIFLIRRYRTLDVPYTREVFRRHGAQVQGVPSDVYGLLKMVEL